MEKKNSFKEIEETDKHLTDDAIKEQVMGSLFLFKNLFQVVELFTSNFNNSVKEMLGGRHNSDQPIKLPKPSQKSSNIEDNNEI